MTPLKKITKQYRLILKQPTKTFRRDTWSSTGDSWLPYDWHKQLFCRPAVYGGEEIDTTDLTAAVQAYATEVARILANTEAATVSLYENTITWEYDNELEDYVRVGSSPALLSQTSNKGQ